MDKVHTGKLLGIKKGVGFVRDDVWRIPLRTLPRKKAFLLRQLRIFLLAFRGFREDKCNLRASALTFYSLMSIVPVVAMAFGIAKGFGLEKLLEKTLIEKMPGQEEIVGKIIAFSHSMLQNAKGGLIAGIGLLALFWLVMKLLGNIENSFNAIWGIINGRSFGRKMSDYLSMMLICPVLFIAASSATVFISTQITLITHKIALLGKFSLLIELALKILPICVIWFLFSFINIFMPNTKVRFSAGIGGGILAGTIFQIVQWAYIKFQIGVAKYGAIYGSFAALPLFLVWLQTSWIVVLFGAEITFACQNVDTYEFEHDSLKVSPSFKKLLSLQIVHLCVKNFCRGEKPWNVTQISHALEIPIRLVNLILSELVECHVLSETGKKDGGETGFQPAVDVEKLTISYVLDALDSIGVDNIPVAETEEIHTLSEKLQEFRTIVNAAKANLVLKNI